MKIRRSSVVAKTVAIAALGSAAAIAFPGTSMAEVSWERLMNPEPENWLMYGGNLGGWRYSELDMINTANVDDLVVRYIFSIGGRATGGTLAALEEGVILADAGNLYTVDGWARVMKWDATSGNAARPLWRFNPEITKSRTQRGVALFDDGVFIGTNDTRLFRINADTGEVVWEVVATAAPHPEYGTPSPDTQGFTTEPIVVHTAGGMNVVIQGESTGGQDGTISYVVAANAETGEIVWRTFTIPFPGEPGHETWADDHQAWRTGGAGVWSHPTFDPETNLVYHGTGDAMPSFDPAFRPGDNLYASSTIALDADTGQMAWYFQLVPNEQWDFDQPGTRMLYDAADGTAVAAVFARSGHYYTHNRETGEILGVWEHTPVTWTAGIDEKTGLPVDYQPGQVVQTYAGVGPVRGQTTGDSCPTWNNAATALNPSAFDPTTRLAYLQFAEGCAGGATLTAWPDEAQARATNGLSRIGQGAGTTIQRTPPAVPPVYTIIAMNVDTGERVAEYKNADISSSSYGGVLLSAGGLAWAGTAVGDVQIFNSQTLEPLWTYNIGMEIGAPFSTWAHDGQQYFGVVGGGNGNGLWQRSATVVVWGLNPN
jgi:alcohol dehydrogenase (cytochrome c)